MNQIRLTTEQLLAIERWENEGGRISISRRVLEIDRSPEAFLADDATHPSRQNRVRGRRDVSTKLYGYRTTGGVVPGKGINSVSCGTGAKRPSRQSSLACSMRSRELDTKFHQM